MQENRLYLVTGGAGFIGSNFIRYFLKKYTTAKVICFDKLTYAGNLENLDDLTANPHYCFIRGDVANPRDVQDVFEQFNPDYIIHFAAESHVDRSIMDSDVFVRTNVQGTQVLLDFARMNGAKRFLQISTDEVYGSLGEEAPSPRAAPWRQTAPTLRQQDGRRPLCARRLEDPRPGRVHYPVLQQYGPYQFPEKLIPLIIHNAMHDKPLPVYGDGLNVRDWIYVEDHWPRHRPGAAQR
jgi:dTDP-glucose 4,6-dehydratase